MLVASLLQRKNHITEEKSISTVRLLHTENMIFVDADKVYTLQCHREEEAHVTYNLN